MALESYHWRVFVELCLYGVEFRMIGLLRRRLEEAERLWDSSQAVGLPWRAPASFLRWPQSSRARGSGFQGLVSWEVGWPTNSAFPGLRGYPEWGTFCFQNQKGPRKPSITWLRYRGVLSLLSVFLFSLKQALWTFPTVGEAAVLRSEAAESWPGQACRRQLALSVLFFLNVLFGIGSLLLLLLFLLKKRSL